MNIFEQIPDILKKYSRVALCVITETKGSTPMKTGAKILVCPDRKIIGTIGGGALEMAVIENALHCLEKKSAQTFVHHLTKDHQMCCGGTVTVFVDIITSLPKLYIFGAGHIGKSLANLASLTGFIVFLIDERKDLIASLSQNLCSEKIHLIPAPYIEYMENLSDDETKDSYCVILTYHHQTDRLLLLHSTSKAFKYIGMIGSKRKTEIAKKFLHQNDVSKELIESIDMPIGIDIHAYYPEEIAVSILAKLISVKNKDLRKEKNISSSSTLNTELCIQNL